MPRQEHIQSGLGDYYVMKRSIIDFTQLRHLDKEQYNAILFVLPNRYAGVRQLQRLTGIDKNIISNVSKTIFWQT